MSNQDIFTVHITREALDLLVKAINQANYLGFGGNYQIKASWKQIRGAEAIISLIEVPLASTQVMDSA